MISDTPMQMSSICSVLLCARGGQRLGQGADDGLFGAGEVRGVGTDDSDG
jgi:hypothetical protein